MLDRLFSQYFTLRPTGVLHVAGENNTGKSRTLRRWIETFGLAHPSLHFYLIDTETKLDVRGYHTLAPEVQDRIFVHGCHSVTALAGLFRIILRDPAPKLVVLDSFSALLKGQLSTTEDFSEYMGEVGFVGEQVLPACARLCTHGAGLILVHHMAFAVKQQQVMPYYFALGRLVHGAWCLLYHCPGDDTCCAGSFVIPNAMPPYRVDFTYPMESPEKETEKPQ